MAGLLTCTYFAVQARMSEHVTKLISLNTFFKNISWRFHWNMMKQIEDILSHVRFGPDSPNCPVHFCPFCLFCLFPQEPEFSWTCDFRRMIDNNKVFHFQQKKYASMDKIFVKTPKTPFLGHFGSFWAIFSQICSNGIFFWKIRSCHFWAFMNY